MQSCRSCFYLSVEPDREDVVGVAVVTNFRAFLKVIDVHSSWHGQTDHNHQAAGEQSLHYIDIWTLHWEEKPDESLEYLYTSTQRSYGKYLSCQNSFIVHSQ